LVSFARPTLTAQKQRVEGGAPEGEGVEPARVSLRINFQAASGRRWQPPAVERAQKRQAHEARDAMTMKIRQTIWMGALCGALMIAGCKISDEGSGKDKKVSIEGPGASLHVDSGAVANDSGIPVYPGAQEKSNTGRDKAHVDLSLPFLKLNIVKLNFTSEDAPEKVVAFYRNKLGSYGAVLECRGGGQDFEVGSGRGLDSPVRCDKTMGNRNEMTLKAGTEGNQHVVQVKPNGKGSEFTLMYIQIGKGKSDSDFGGKQPS